jgi:anti-sigma regulatory factor (Ser/Thr protein kinase)
MTGVTVRESVKVAGLVERVRVVRSFVGAVLGPGHPCGDDAILLASELFANSLRHSSSGLPGETVTVTITADAAAVWVEVADRSGPGVPELRPAGADAEDGRGLGIVERLADRWGWRRRGGRTVTWFVKRAELHLMQHSADSRKWRFRSSLRHSPDGPVAVRQA